MSVLTVKNLTVSFHDDEKIIDNLNFSVEEGEIMAILGPNGAGKTVLFRALLGLIPYQGEINWRKDIKIGYVPQKIFIDRNMPLTVGEFFDLKLKSSAGSKNDILKSVGFSGDQLERILDRKIGLLSGGQIQRILVAWGIFGNPQVLLFDEPTSGIDVGAEETIYNLLDRLQKERRITLLLISHDFNVVYRHANKVLCLNRQKLCYGAPAEVLDPRHMNELYGGEISFYKHNHSQ